MGIRGIPPKGSIPGRQSKELRDVLGGTGNILGGLLGGVEKLLGDALKGLGKTLESVQNLNLEDLEKLAETQGDEGVKEKVKELKRKLGEKGLGDLGDLFKGGLDLGKLIEFAKKHGGEFSQEFAGGQGMIRSGVRGRVLGIPFGGKDLPLERRKTKETQFDVRGSRGKTSTTQKERVEVQEPEMDPIEEAEGSFIVRGYMAGVEERNIFCGIENNGTVLRITADGRRRYEKEIDLPSPAKQASWSYKNGVLEIILRKETERGE